MVDQKNKRMEDQENAIRNQYAKLGVEEYYKQHGADYENPHFPIIEQLLVQNKDQIDYSQVLDLCCGSGEVTSVLKKLGFDKTVGCDPFTHELYRKQTKATCFEWTFKDIMRGKLTGQYSAIICSFALHLAEEKSLYALCQNLFKCSETLVIITPHKRPQLEQIQGVQKVYEDFALTDRLKKVHLKMYQVLPLG